MGEGLQRQKTKSFSFLVALKLCSLTPALSQAEREHGTYNNAGASFRLLRLDAIRPAGVEPRRHLDFQSLMTNSHQSQTYLLADSAAGALP